jgi:hypothetical protein
VAVLRRAGCPVSCHRLMAFPRVLCPKCAHAWAGESHRPDSQPNCSVVVGVKAAEGAEGKP